METRVYLHTTLHIAGACAFVYLANRPSASPSGVAELDVGVRRDTPPIGPETSSMAFPADRGSADKTVAAR